MWYQKFTDNLRDVEFYPCIADADLWMRDCGNNYEYVSVIVYDILILIKIPELIIQLLK